MKKIKPNDIPRIKESWSKIVPDDASMESESLDVFRFKRETIILANEVIFRIDMRKKLLFRNILSVFSLVVITGINLFCLANNPIGDDCSLLIMLHALATTTVLYFFPETIKIEIKEINRVVEVFSDFYLNGLRKLKFSHTDLKTELAKINTSQSKRGFEASWKCINRNNYLG